MRDMEPVLEYPIEQALPARAEWTAPAKRKGLWFTAGFLAMILLMGRL